MITLDDIKQNCRIDGNDSDLLLEKYLNAAKEALKQQTSRNWYTDTVPDDDETGLVYNEATDVALLLLVGHWFSNRESITNLNLTETPQGFWFLIQPYRIYGA